MHSQLMRMNSSCLRHMYLQRILHESACALSYVSLPRRCLHTNPSNNVHKSVEASLQRRKMRSGCRVNIASLEHPTQLQSKPSIDMLEKNKEKSEKSIWCHASHVLSNFSTPRCTAVVVDITICTDGQQIHDHGTCTVQASTLDGPKQW